jgi:hypothetical protein
MHYADGVPSLSFGSCLLSNLSRFAAYRPLRLRKLRSESNFYVLSQRVHGDSTS